MSDMALTQMDLEKLQNQLKDRSFFEQAVSPIQLSAIFAKLFLIIAITLAVFFLVPLFWRFMADGLNVPDAYKTIFNAKMGGGIALFCVLLSGACWGTARWSRKKVYGRAHQAYLENPIVYTISAVLRRENVILYAYARSPSQQKAIEELLTSALTHSTKVYDTAYARIRTSRMKHKAVKMNELKKKIINETPGLGFYEFPLNCCERPVEKGDRLYCLFLEKGLIALHGNYLRLRL